MITELSIGNFKAFAAPQRVPIKPLTLIFGANSSGKSSIIHSLLLANHALEGGSWEVTFPRLGGGTVDLGGYPHYLHDPRKGGVFEFGAVLQLLPSAKDEFEAEALSMLPHWKSAAFTTSFGRRQRKAAGCDAVSTVGIRSFQLEADRTVIFKWDLAEDGRPKRPVFDSQWIVQDVKKLIEERLHQLRGNTNQFGVADWVFDDLTNDEVAKIDATVRGCLSKVLIREGPLGPSVSADIYRDDSDSSWFTTDKKRTEWIVDLAESVFDQPLTDLFSKTVGALATFIRNLSYLGPMRSTPPRYLPFSLVDETTRQATGLAAWQTLSDDRAVRETVNNWLRELGARSEITARDLVWADKPELGPVHRVLDFQDMISGAHLSHHDLGFGVGQILPILVMAAEHKKRPICVEQPELHLHPAMQAELGDVFIESALGERKNTFLLETHSEHLILRILRRVRETTEGKLPEGKTPVRPEDVSVVYVQPGPNGSEVIELPVTPDGDFAQPWPGGFFAERFQDLP